MSISQRILLIEDDQDIREAIRDALELQGFELLVTDDGIKGLATALSEPLDLIILDLVLPGRSGLSVLEHLRNSRVSPRVIMITGMPDEKFRISADRHGVDRFLLKPFKLTELIQAVSETLTFGAATVGLT